MKSARSGCWEEGEGEEEEEEETLAVPPAP